MKAIVIGGGLIGVTTAYFLRSRGHDVTVIERQGGVAEETSFANGGFLSPSMAEPWNAPGCWRVLLRSIGRSDAAIQLRWRALPSLMGWGVGFLRNSSPVAFERNTRSNVRLALYSLEVLHALLEKEPIEYGRGSGGALKVFRSERALDQACAAVARSSSEGLTYSRLSPSDVAEREPALAPIIDRLSGGIHYAADETGNAYQFCTGLAERARRQGVRFCFQNSVFSLEARLGRVSAVLTQQGRLVADRYILAAGSYSTPLLHGIGLKLPVRPAKGYSVSFEMDPEHPALTTPVIDDDLHAALVPLGGVLRLAGTAEFAGYDRRLAADRIRNLTQLLNEVLPRAPFDPTKGMAWCGLRAMSVDGVPIIGRTSIENLFINTGHGHLGWTMAAGSASLLADLIGSQAPSIDPAPFAPSRFGI